jgi:hypothetical protein
VLIHAPSSSYAANPYIWQRFVGGGHNKPISLARYGEVYLRGEERAQLQSDNGKVFTSKHFQACCKQYGLSQEFITPYTPQQNGMIERFFRSLKEECIWQHHFKTFEEAKAAIEAWVTFYNIKHPYQASLRRSTAPLIHNYTWLDTRGALQPVHPRWPAFHGLRSGAQGLARPLGQSRRSEKLRSGSCSDSGRTWVPPWPPLNTKSSPLPCLTLFDT